MKIDGTKPTFNEDKEHLKQLQEWAAGSDSQYVPELLIASSSYSGLFDDDLVNQLLERLYKVENQPRIWLQYAHSILPVYKKTKNDSIKIKFLSYIYEFNEKIQVSWQTNCNPVIKGTGLFFRENLPLEIEKLRRED